MIRRREFIAGLGSAAAWPETTHRQWPPVHTRFKKQITHSIPNTLPRRPLLFGRDTVLNVPEGVHND